MSVLASIPPSRFATGCVVAKWCQWSINSRVRGRKFGLAVQSLSHILVRSQLGELTLAGCHILGPFAQAAGERLLALVVAELLRQHEVVQQSRPTVYQAEKPSVMQPCLDGSGRLAGGWEFPWELPCQHPSASPLFKRYAR